MSGKRIPPVVFAALAVMLIGATSAAAQTTSETDWPAYGNDPGGMRYSQLTQVNRENVSRLKVAWIFHTGDISPGDQNRRRSGFEATPIFVDGTLFVTTGFNRVIALDPETGRQRWAYDPKVDLTLEYGDGLINRGVSTWLDPKAMRGQPCRRRLYEATLDARLISLDAETGKPCMDFGDYGQVVLRDVPEYQGGWYHMTSPPAVIDDLVIVGSAIDDNARAAMPSGVVRAFDARTGRLRWSWNPIPLTQTAANGKAPEHQVGAANAWSIMTVDPERDLLFVPTGSASPDYYGGLRPGDNKWANSVVALHAKSGEIAWGFQLVHHDLWDYDSAAAPLLATLQRGKERIPVVIQGNKTGNLFVLNRDTGKPVFDVQERPVPPSDIPGEIASPTQPFPISPPPLAVQKISVDDAWGPTPADLEWCRKEIGGLRHDGIFTPPSLQGTIETPGVLGGMNWSGYAFDPQRNLLITNTNNLPTKIRLIPRSDFWKDEFRTEQGEYSPQTGAPYGLFRRFIQSPSDMPCVAPPWGSLVAVNMTNGKILWKVPLGSMQDFGHKQPPIPPGAFSLGGPIVTASGLVFTAGTFDHYLRAFDTENGKELWKGPLPNSGHATPMTFRYKGKQYVVIAAGGHDKISEETIGDALVAFTLP